MWQIVTQLFLPNVLASLARLGLLVSGLASHSYFLVVAQGLVMAVFNESQIDEWRDRHIDE